MKKIIDWQPNPELRARRLAARPFPTVHHPHPVVVEVQADEETSNNKFVEDLRPSDFVAHVSSSTEFDPKTKILRVYIEGELVARYKLFGIGKLVPVTSLDSDKKT